MPGLGTAVAVQLSSWTGPGGDSKVRQVVEGGVYVYEYRNNSSDGSTKLGWGMDVWE